MNRKESIKQINKLEKGIIVILGSTLFLAYNFVYTSNYTTYINESFVILVSYVVVSSFYLYSISLKSNFDIFHPIHLITFLYVCIFCITPLILISENKTDCFGVNVMDGCISASIIFVLSYIFFVFGYNLKEYKYFKPIKYPRVKNKVANKIVNYSLVIWFLSFLLSLYYLFITGRSIQYIMSLGNNGSVTAMDTNMLFLSNFTLAMIVPLIYIFIYGRSKIIVYTLFFLTFSTMYVRGFRIFILIMVVSLCIVYFKKQAKKPSLKFLTFSLAVIILFFTIIGGLRNGLRTGNSANNFEISKEVIFYTLETNFDIYKPFYGLVIKYPENYNYTLGKSMIWDSIINWIPRAIWYEKPLASEQTMPVGLKNSVSDFAIEGAGMAWPNIAEFYMEFGVIGCLFFFFLFGFLSKWLIKLYYSLRVNDLIIYSVSIPLIFQFIIRGAFAQFIPFVVFTLLPYFIIKTITNENYFSSPRQAAFIQSCNSS